MGGLGNQMFQYALGKHLAVKNNVELKLDLTFLLDRTLTPNFTFRNYELDIFNINAPFAIAHEIANFTSPYYKNRLKRKIFGYQSVNEHQFNFDKVIFNASRNTYLVGYWQSEKYFKPIEATIRKDFFFNPPLDNDTDLLLKQMEDKNAVCINVRRGDYVSNPDTNKFLGVQGLDYFSEAIAILVKKISNPHFYIFSDDIDWCKENFKELEYPNTIVEHDYAGKRFENYLYLMSKCKHFIIPNSTFAWWAAWLCSNPNKIVIAPEKWFADTEMNKQTIDLIPERWIRI